MEVSRSDTLRIPAIILRYVEYVKAATITELAYRLWAPDQEEPLSKHNIQKAVQLLVRVGLLVPVTHGFGDDVAEPYKPSLVGREIVRGASSLTEIEERLKTLIADSSWT